MAPTNANDVPKSDDNLVGILKNGPPTAALTNGVTTAPVDADIPREPTSAPPALNGVIRRNSSTASLRQFVNSASPLIEEASDEEDDDDNDNDADNDANSNDEEDLSENPVRDR